MSYIRNPRLPHTWESDGDAPWGKYKAADGTMHDSANQADKHDLDKKQHQWWPEAAPEIGTIRLVKKDEEIV